MSTFEEPLNCTGGALVENHWFKVFHNCAYCAIWSDTAIWVGPGWKAFPVLQPNILAIFVNLSPVGTFLSGNQINFEDGVQIASP